MLPRFFRSLSLNFAIQYKISTEEKSVSINSPLLELNKLKGSLCQCA